MKKEKKDAMVKDLKWVKDVCLGNLLWRMQEPELISDKRDAVTQIDEAIEVLNHLKYDLSKEVSASQVFGISASQVSQLMKEQGMDAQKLSEVTGVSWSLLDLWLKGSHDLDWDSVNAICRFFEIGKESKMQAESTTAEEMKEKGKKIKLSKDKMDILLASKKGFEEVSKCIFQSLAGIDDVDTDDKYQVLVLWLESVLLGISSQDHELFVGANYSMAEYLRYMEHYKEQYESDLALDKGVALFLANKLRGVRFTVRGEDVFEVIQ